MIVDLLTRIVISVIFAAIATVFLSLSFFVLKEKDFLKKNLRVAGIFALVLFVFSFFSSLSITIIAAIIALLIVKYIYVRTWKETLAVWGIWVGLWLILIVFLSTIIWLVKPFPALL